MSNTTGIETDDLDDFIISEEEGRALFDQVARERLGISGQEFQRRWHAGEYYDVDTDDVIKLYMMLPLVERIESPTARKAGAGQGTIDSTDWSARMSNAARVETDNLDDFIIDPEEGRALFDATARRLLGISGEEFQRRWHAGEYYDVDTYEVIKLHMMLPLVEHIPTRLREASCPT